MHRQITIELQVEFPKRKMGRRLVKVARQAARHLYAAAILASTKSRPRIALYSDDFFSGHEELTIGTAPKPFAKKRPKRK